MVDSALTVLGTAVRKYDYIQKPGILRFGQLAEGILVEGYPDGSAPPGLARIEIDGDDTPGEGEIIIGLELAHEIGINIGDQLVIFDISNLHRVATSRRLQAFTVIGIYHSGLQEYDRSLAYIALSSAQKLFGHEDKITGAVLFLDNTAQVHTLSIALENYLGYPYFVLTWKEKHRLLFNWLSVQKWPILIIFGMIAFVGVVNIISALTMIVLEKIREIGILRSMGLSRRRIRRVFLIEGTIIGIFGSGSGALVAAVLARIQDHFHLFTIPEEVYFMDHVPAHFDFTTALIFIAVGVISAMLASLWPTKRAAAVIPSEALHYE